MHCFKVTIEYDGTDFAGFQYQVGQRNVQVEIEGALGKLTGMTPRVHGAGRTDAGVHALGQVVSFQVETSIPLEKMAAAMNSALPHDISAVAAEETNEEFHARFSAKSRRYLYVMLNRPLPSALFRRFAYHVALPLDVEGMKIAARSLIGTQDFAAWANSTNEVRSTIRTVTRCAVRQSRGFVLVQMEANAFLRGMVRNVVGTLVQVGTGKRDAEEVAEITISCDRNKAGPSAPPHGLCLMRVGY